MSFFSSIGKVLGSVGKVVAKTALNVGGGVIGVSGLGNSLFDGGSTSSPTNQVQTYSGPVGGNYSFLNTSPLQPQSYSTPGNGAAPNTLSGMLSELPQMLGVLSGNRAVQVNATSSALPTWLLPVVLIGGLLLAFVGLRGKR